MKPYQKLLACGLIGISSFLGCDKDQIKEAIKTATWPVYDPQLKQFIQRKRGINETVLNSLDLEYRTKDMLDYYQKVENREQDLEFMIRDKYEGGISVIQTLYTMIDNLEIIEVVDDTPDVKEKYKPLKELLTKCNKIYENTEEDSIERIIKLHDIISEYVKPGEDTPDSVFIVDLVNGKLGNCNDISPAYFALFNYYHIDCYVAIGKTENSLHAWLYVKTPKFNFELDPTWYKRFTPLDIRNKETEMSSLKEKYMRYKK